MNRILLFPLLLFGVAVVQGQPATQPPVSTVKGIHRISLSVRDLGRSLAFYQRATGLSVEPRRDDVSAKAEKKSGLDAPPRQVAVLRGPNARLELVQFDGASRQPPNPLPVPGPGITHVCYQTSATVSVYARAKALGATIVSRGSTPVDRGYGIRYAYLRDADGLLFELEQFEKPPFTDSLWVGHVALVTPDIDRLVGFYQNLLGVAPHNRIDNIRNSPKLNDIANIDDLRLRGAWFRAGNLILEIWQFENPPTPPVLAPPSSTQIGYRLVGFEVGDLPREYNRLRAGGAQFLAAPVATPNGPVAYLRDPDGNLLSLEEVRPDSPESVTTLKRLTP